MEEKVKLTQFSRGSGCGCKIPSPLLREIISHSDDLPPDPRVIVGYETSDDAAVVLLPDGNALISTTDFFTPVVDDPFDFGRIAATNALSDIYAMGGSPLVAIAILGWPAERIPANAAREVMRGARFITRMAGISIAGGHSIDSLEPFFGLSVNGLVNPHHIKRNNAARPGDLIFLTKPLGTGMIAAALKRGLASALAVEEAVNWMTRLNNVGTALSHIEGVHAMTDITGFGLAGHLSEMLSGTGFSATIRAEDIPLIGAVDEMINAMIYPDMTMKNYSAYKEKVNELDLRRLMILCDPQTSGGLMVAVDENAVDEYLAVIRDFGLNGIADKSIGQITAGTERLINVL